MDVTRRAERRPDDDIESRLADIDAASEPEVVDLVERALAEIDDRAPTDPVAESVERAVVRGLSRRPDVDRLLDRLGPAALGQLLDRGVTRAAAGDGAAWRRHIWELLDLTRRPSVLRRIEREQHPEWSERLLTAIETTGLTVGPLFRQRAERYGSKTLFRVPEHGGTRTVSWRRTASRVELIARGLTALDPERKPAPVAILSENRIEVALVDLACLTTGLIDVMVPANSTEADVEYILRHARVRTVVVSGESQLRKVLARRDALPELRHVITLDSAAGSQAIRTLDEVVALSDRVAPTLVLERSEAVSIDDLATVMYTSGTTGTPKGIKFSHRNLVFKRFARALAIPEIGEDDVFLCFLPLFHTFGRFLEMLGCVFWGATYCFLDSPAVEALVREMRAQQPTVFISVPKKWIQLYEAISRRANPLEAGDAELLAATREITGGRLRWGLSAAGYLDPDIFGFFARHGIELMSGFGMTEATGGITMTPPGEYRDESLGYGLPGIELKLADDGELCIRGPYVMIGYLDPPDGEPSFDEDGWFHSGDLMARDGKGHLRLVDRKKEIYKNVKGETIAPQRIENLFRDFDSVSRVFLVGDHREFNTLLIYPNYDDGEPDFRSLSAQETKDHFRSLVVSVNQFLAPYERIVDFAVIDRDLDPERGELTPKGTPRRTQVVKSFDSVIRLLYRRTNLQVGGVELTLPNWLFQTVGITAQDIRVGDEGILLPRGASRLTVRRIESGLTQIGSCLYDHPPGALNLGTILTTPRLWLGNEELVDFIALDVTQRRRPGRDESGIEWRGRVGPFRTDDAAVDSTETLPVGLLDVHRAACWLGSAEAEVAEAAVERLAAMFTSRDEIISESARLVLGRVADTGGDRVARRTFELLVPAERPGRFPATLRRFLDRFPSALDETTRRKLARALLPTAKLDAFLELTRADAMEDSGERDDRAISLLSFLADYGAAHPASYRGLRAFLVQIQLFARRAAVRAAAGRAAAGLLDGFRAWLGPTARIAVDSETGEEYHWDDVAVFDEEIPPDDRRRLLEAIRTTALLREASFLFAKGILLRLDDIPPGGIWIRPLGSKHGKAVYRITIQTRFQGSVDLAVNVNHTLSAEQVAEEIHWLILSGASSGQPPLVEDFGGYWPDFDLWSEEFISGETLARAMQRLARRPDEDERLLQLWPFLAWTALSAYVDFWHRCGGLWEIADPSMTNVVVPTDDYQTGVRIVSVSIRRRHRGTLGMMRSLMDEFIKPGIEQYPKLAGIVGWDIVFSSVLEIIGEERGLALLESTLEEGVAEDVELHSALRRYTSHVRRRGFLPRRLFFAAKRYRRWARLSGEATPQARARTLQELYETYGLQRLAQDYPETRVRFFRETVFRDAPPELLDGLDELIAKLRSGEWVGDELIDGIAELRERLTLREDHEYFLTRIFLPHLRPEDAADFVSSDLGGRHQSEIVVNLEDQEGSRFRVRHALNPKEVGRLHRLFLSAKLDVRFRPEHRYLVALSDRTQIIGGIYYEIEEDGETAHLEKIVVTDSYRRKGVAGGLMNEFFNRLRAAGVKNVTTGFFRPEYFYSYGFRIEKRYAGLVKSLTDEAPTESKR